MSEIMSNPRICIVGAGALSSRRIYPYIGAAGGRLVGVCDLDTERAAKNAGLFGGAVYPNFEQMLAEQKPDGVIVCVGPGAHAKLARQILELGYPVYTEKPPAATAEDALQVARLAQKTGLLCTTAFKKRYTEAATRARKWLEKFPEADRLSLSIDYCSGGYANDTIEKSFLLDFGIHVIDLAPYLFGEVESVFAFAKGMNAYAVSLRFRCGAVGSLNLNDGRSWSVPTEETELTVKGGHFMTIHNSATWRITEDGKPAEWREPCTFISSGDSGRDTGHVTEIEDFFAALKEERTTRSNIYESYKSMVLYEAIRASAESGQVVRPVYQPL
ncbi:MAG: Gfo/Idh/MocA family oxidoreductase [Methylacidiphilales bacterium]|nr:Gfo/Idh/MocA family oxidoreductase [Candidatus Methylacidiphilales bacterium]